MFGDKVQQFSSLAQSAQAVIGWTLSGNDRGAGERLFELPGNLAVAGAVYYTTFAMIPLHAHAPQFSHRYLFRGLHQSSKR